MPRSHTVSTKTQIEELPAKATTYPVPVVPTKGSGARGLYIQVTPAGAKSFVLRFRVHGRQKTLTIGRFPDMGIEKAISEALRHWNDIREGRNPSDTKRQDRNLVTFKDLATRYIREHFDPGEDDAGKEATRLINKHILPELGSLPLAQVGPSDITSVLSKLRGTPVQANRTRGVMRTMFGRAEEWEMRPLGSNPVTVVKLRHTEAKRARRLSDLELKSLGAALRASHEPPVYLLAVRLALMAGMRKGEIAELRWSYVNLDAGEITIPPDHHKTGKKTKKKRLVFLCDALVAQLKATVRNPGCPYVIPGEARKDKKGEPLPWQPIVGLQGPWERIRDSAGLAPKNEEGEYLDENENPTWHDLRRTFASVAADLSLKPFAGDLLGHAEESVTDIYTRVAAERLHDAAEAIGSRIDGILRGTIDPEKEALKRKAAKQARVKNANGKKA